MAISFWFSELKSQSGDFFFLKAFFRPTQTSQRMPAFHQAPVTAQIPGTLFKGRHFQPAGLLRSSSHRELPRGTAEGSDQGSQVQQHTHPAGGHLDPKDGPASAEEGFNVGTFITVETRANCGQSRKRTGREKVSSRRGLPAPIPPAFLVGRPPVPPPPNSWFRYNSHHVRHYPHLLPAPGIR